MWWILWGKSTENTTNWCHPFPHGPFGVQEEFLPLRSRPELSGLNKRHKPLMPQQVWGLDLSRITVGHPQVQIQWLGICGGCEFRKKPLSDSELRELKAGAKRKVVSDNDSLSRSFGTRREGWRPIIVASARFPPGRSGEQVGTLIDLNSKVLANRPLKQHGKSVEASGTRAGRQAETPEI